MLYEIAATHIFILCHVAVMSFRFTSHVAIISSRVTMLADSSNSVSICARHVVGCHVMRDVRICFCVCRPTVCRGQTFTKRKERVAEYPAVKSKKRSRRFSLSSERYDDDRQNRKNNILVLAPPANFVFRV